MSRYVSILIYLVAMSCAIGTCSDASAALVTFFFSGYMNASDADFTAGDPFNGSYTFDTATPGNPTPPYDSSITVEYPAVVSWTFQFPTKGYSFTGDFGFIPLGNNTLGGDRYIVTVDDVSSIGTPLPSGRSPDLFQFELDDSTDADILQSSDLPIFPPRFNPDDFAGGRIHFTNSDDADLTVNQIVPEPSSLTLVTAAVVGFVAISRWTAMRRRYDRRSTFT